MCLKQELQIWSAALDAFDKQDFTTALSCFEQMADSSKVRFNIGMIHATLNDHSRAIEHFRRSTALDGFLAVAHFQRGVSLFLLGRCTEARDRFEDAITYLRGNALIDYEQIGLDFRLYECEVIFNRGLAALYSRDVEAGMTDLRAASKQKRKHDHSVIDDAIAAGGHGYTVFSVPVGALFRPADAKLRNLEPRDYLGKAKLVAATSLNDVGTAFSGLKDTDTRSIKRKESKTDAVQLTPRPSRERSATTPEPVRPLQMNRGRSASTSAATTTSNGSTSRTPSSKRVPPPRPSRTGLELQLPTPPGSSLADRRRMDPHLRSPSMPHFPRLPPPPATPTHARSGSVPSMPTPSRSNIDIKTLHRDSPVLYRGAEVIDGYFPSSPTPMSDDSLEQLTDATSAMTIGGLMLGSSSAPISASTQAPASNAPSNPPSRSTTSSSVVSRIARSPSDSSTRQTTASPASLSRSGSAQSSTLSSSLVSRLRNAQMVMGQDPAASDGVHQVRVRLRHQGSTRAMLINSSISLELFRNRVALKLGEEGLSLRYQDMDGTLVSIVDSEDWESESS